MNTDNRQRIESLLRDGHSDRAVHQATGAARTTVARYRKRLGLPGYHTTPDSPNCRHGHPWPENRRESSDGWSYCLECKRARQRRWWAENYPPEQPDEVAIQRATAGDPPGRLTQRERHAAIRQLDAKGLSAAVIAERVRCSKRTVHRARAAA